MKNIQTTLKAWHVIYTKSRAEKKVHSGLQAQDIESFLPMQKKLHQWKDRKKWVETPLIPGYCFVNITQKEYDKVLQTNNVVCYITFEGRAAIIPKCQIEALKTMLKQYEPEITVSNENYQPGQKVEIIEGPMVGIKGELIKNKGKSKFLIHVKQINTSFGIEISAHKLAPVLETVF